MQPRGKPNSDMHVSKGDDKKRLQNTLKGLKGLKGTSVKTETVKHGLPYL